MTIVLLRRKVANFAAGIIARSLRRTPSEWALGAVARDRLEQAFGEVLETL